MFGSSHELVQLITQCLDYAPSTRPTASETMDRLQHISSSIHDDYHTMTRLQLEKELKVLKLKDNKTEVSYAMRNLTTELRKT